MVILTDIFTNPDKPVLNRFITRNTKIPKRNPQEPSCSFVIIVVKILAQSKNIIDIVLNTNLTELIHE